MLKTTIRSIQTKFLVVGAIAVVLSAVVGLSLAVVQQQHLHQLLRSTAVDDANQTAFVVSRLATLGHDNQIQDALELLRVNPDFSYAKLVDNNGIPMAVLGEAPPGTCGGFGSNLVRETDSILEVSALVRVHGTVWGCLRVGISRERAHRDAMRALMTTAGMSILTMLVTALSVFYLSRSIALPITRLAESVSRFGKGDWKAEINVSSKDEVGMLANSFRSMMEEIRNTTVSKTYVDDVLQSMAESLVVVDDHGIIRVANRATHRLLAYTDDALLGQPAARIVGKETWQLLTAGGPVQIQAEYVAQDGERIPVSVSSAFMRAEDKGLIWMAQDLRERKRAEERFSKAFNASPELISITTFPEGRLLDANESFFKGTGYGREIMGYTFKELGLVPEPEESRLFFETMSSKHVVRDMEMYFLTKSGEKRSGLVSAEFIEIEGKQCLLTLVKDLTEWKSLEKQLQQAQKMEAIGRLTGGIAHDFNNLLGIIIGYSELLQEALSDDAASHRKAEQIWKAGNRAAALTTQLLAFSRQQVLKSRILDLNEVIDDIDKMLRPMIGEDVELCTILDPELRPIEADKSQIEQVIMNLAINARDAMPNGGKLLIETSNASLRVNQLYSGSPQGQCILMTVTDTGMGMDAETQLRIFEPFFTTKAQGKGTGLGLATVYGIVKQSAGHVVVDSALGQGTKFHIYLPEATQSAEIAPASEGVEKYIQGSGRVLLVEDETALRVLLHGQLEEAGYTVIEAEGPDKALEIAASSASIDLIFTDVVMPGMNGPTLVEELVRISPNAEVLYMSGYTGDSVVLRRLLDSGKTILQKPFTRGALLRRVKEVLEAGKARKRIQVKKKVVGHKMVLSTPIRILVLEDKGDDATLLMIALKNAGIQADCKVVSAAEEFMEEVRTNSYQLVLADYGLSGWTGLDALRWLRKSDYAIPFIFVTGTLGDEQAVKCVKEGASDYILKNHMNRLPQAIMLALQE